LFKHLTESLIAHVAKLLEYALAGKPEPLFCPKSDGFLRSYFGLRGVFLSRSFGLLLFD